MASRKISAALAYYLTYSISTDLAKCQEMQLRVTVYIPV